jgi:hypothetical protein
MAIRPIHHRGHGQSVWVIVFHSSRSLKLSAHPFARRLCTPFCPPATTHCAKAADNRKHNAGFLQAEGRRTGLSVRKTHFRPR